MSVVGTRGWPDVCNKFIPERKHFECWWCRRAPKSKRIDKRNMLKIVGEGNKLQQWKLDERENSLRKVYQQFCLAIKQRKQKSSPHSLMLHKYRGLLHINIRKLSAQSCTYMYAFAGPRGKQPDGVILVICWDFSNNSTYLRNWDQAYLWLPSDFC